MNKFQLVYKQIILCQLQKVFLNYKYQKMSNSLLKRSLAIIEESLDSEKNRKGSKAGPSSKQKSTSKLAPASIKIKDKNKSLQIKGKQKPTIKSAIATAQRNKSKIEENRKKLLMLDSDLKMNDDIKETLLRRARTSRYVIPEKKEVEESTTAFTEEDFLKFEKEYFVG